VTVRVAYLVSRYPTVSHAFVLREVEGLRRSGLDIQPFTVVRVDRTELVEDATRDEDGRTIALRPLRPVRLLTAHVRAAVTTPGRYLSTLAAALRRDPASLRGLVWQAAYFAQAVLLAAHLRDLGIRHVHVHHANVAADVAMLACRLDSRLSWSLSLHGPTELQDLAGFRVAEKARDASWVACISDYARAQIAAVVEPEHWPKLHVVRLGVDVDALVPPPRVPRTADEPFRVLSVGRLAPQKGQALLLEAMAGLHARGIDARLVLVGDGPLRGALEAQRDRLGLFEHVRMVGAVGQDRIRAHYAEADAFCLTSFAEGIPVVLMEAMAMGVPVVAPRITGIPELVEDGVSGLLVAPGRSELALEALAALAADPALAARLATAGREVVTLGYEAGRAVSALRALLTGEATMPAHTHSSSVGNA
jgi:colanic acid/amylovoran biosynthesis glycosyltransferase